MDSATPFQPWAADDSTKNVKPERDLADDAKLHRENVNPKHTQTASYDKESVGGASIVAGPSGAATASADPARGKDSKMDAAKVASMQQIVENTLSQEGRQRVAQLLEAVEALSGAERLLLYLRLPTGVPPHDPLKQPVNPLGSRAELQQTVTWIQTHLEVDPDVSLPKQDVYDEYIAHCMSSNMKPLSTADFGKVMKQVYPSVRPRRLGTRGNSRYCYAGLRKKIKLEVPQLPDLGESSKEPSTTSRETERIICEWAEAKIGVKFASLSELSRHLASGGGRAPPSPPPLPQTHGDDPAGRQLLKQLKRKLQTGQGTPGRPKKNKGQEAAGESPPSTSYASHHPPVKHESEPAPEPGYGYQPVPYPVYDVAMRPPFPAYGGPPRAHPAPAPHPAHPAHPGHEYRADPYEFEPPYAARDLTLPPDAAHNLPINLSSDASLDLSTERTEWPRRRPPEPPPHRLPLPGKKLILETYQSETQGGAASPRAAAAPAPGDFPRAEYLPKKMRAAEILGGKLAAARLAPPDAPSTSAASPAPAPPPPPPRHRSDAAFLDDPKNLLNRSKSTAAALAREEQEAASPTRAGKAPTPKADRSRGRRGRVSPERAPPASPDSCCGLDGINIKTGMICEEKHSEILNRERVISICNIDKHDLDDYLNEGNSQEHEEELLKYFQQRPPQPAPPPPAPAHPHARARPDDADAPDFLETGPDHPDEHSQGKNEKLSQLRELLAKNLKYQSGSNSQNQHIMAQETQAPPATDHQVPKTDVGEGAFKPVGPVMTEVVNGQSMQNPNDCTELGNYIPSENGNSLQYVDQSADILPATSGPHSYNGNCHEPQSPTTRTQQYDFVPISEGCHSPGNFNSKSPLGFAARGHSPGKAGKPAAPTSLQTSPVSHSTAASPFVSPRNTPVPRSRLCPRPIPKHNGRRRRNLLSLGVQEPGQQFAMPTDQKFAPRGPAAVRYLQPMSAPPSPNIISSQYKNQMFPTSSMANGTSGMCLNFLPGAPFRDNGNGELAHPLSADPLSSEVSQFFQESLPYRPGPDASFRSQSVPLKQAMSNMGLLSYTNTPVGSVPPTPVPNEFCDFGSLADTCDISKAGLNPETLDKIYDAIDSSNDVLDAGGAPSLMSSGAALSNGCDAPPMLADEQLGPFIPSEGELLDRSGQFDQSFPGDSGAPDNVEDFLKRTDSIEFDLSGLVADKSKYYTSRSVPSTPLPYKRAAADLHVDPRRSRELFVADDYSSVANGISSKSVPSTPQLAEERGVFSYSNRDFLINGNSVDVCGGALGGADGERALASPLDMLREDMLGPLEPAADLLADLDKMDAAPYVDL